MMRYQSGALPVIKGKGTEVPCRTLYHIENIYPADETPVPVRGFEYVKTLTAGDKSLPLCSYPAYPRYTGGSLVAAASYACAR